MEVSADFEGECLAFVGRASQEALGPGRFDLGEEPLVVSRQQVDAREKGRVVAARAAPHRRECGCGHAELLDRERGGVQWLHRARDERAVGRPRACATLRRERFAFVVLSS